MPGTSDQNKLIVFNSRCSLHERRCKVWLWAEGLSTKLKWTSAVSLSISVGAAASRRSRTGHRLHRKRNYLYLCPRILPLLKGATLRHLPPFIRTIGFRIAKLYIVSRSRSSTRTRVRHIVRWQSCETLSVCWFTARHIMIAGSRTKAWNTTSLQ